MSKVPENLKISKHKIKCPNEDWKDDKTTCENVGLNEKVKYFTKLIKY